MKSSKYKGQKWKKLKLQELNCSFPCPMNSKKSFFEVFILVLLFLLIKLNALFLFLYYWALIWGRDIFYHHEYIINQNKLLVLKSHELNIKDKIKKKIVIETK